MRRKHRKLNRVLRALALGARHLRVAIHHNALVVLAAIVANVFINRHFASLACLILSDFVCSLAGGELRRVRIVVQTRIAGRMRGAGLYFFCHVKEENTKEYVLRKSPLMFSTVLNVRLLINGVLATVL